MKKSRFRILSLVLVIFMILPLCFACGDKTDGGNDSGTEAPASGNDTSEENTTEATDPPTTTEKPTVAPTEAPTDPADRPEADEIGIVAGFRYYVANYNSKLYMETYGKRAGSSPTQEEFAAKAIQMYTFEPQGGGIYKIKALNNNCYLDFEYVEGEAVAGKLITTTEEPNTENSQLFRIEKNEDETYSFISMLSTEDTVLSVTVKSVSMDAGGEIILWKGSTAKNQKWILELVADKAE